MSDEPKWVLVNHVTRLHERALNSAGGAAGIRDQTLLESAVARPQNLYGYEGESNHFQLAASYAQGIAQNHPFVDGNKRTAFLTADLFLSLQGYSLDADPSDLHTEQMVALAQSSIDREQFARHLEDHSVRLAVHRDREASERVSQFRDKMRTTRSPDDDRER